MNLKESIRIVQLLHNAYPQDRRATAEDLSQRAQSYHIALADYDFETVQKAAQHCIATSKWYPTTAELIEKVKLVKLTNVPAVKVTPITRAEAIDDERVDEWLEAFCDWIGFGDEANDSAVLPKGVLRFEQ